MVHGTCSSKVCMKSGQSPLRYDISSPYTLDMKTHGAQVHRTLRPVMRKEDRCLGFLLDDESSCKYGGCVCLLGYKVRD